LLPVNKSLVKPRLDYCVQAWRDNQKDTIVLEDLVKRPPDELTDEDKKKNMEEIRRKAALVEVGRMIYGYDRGRWGRGGLEWYISL